MFRFLMRYADGEPFDPPAFITAVPNWEVDEVVMLGPNEHVRILEIVTEIPEELVDQGFNGVWFVEPVNG